MKEAYRDMMRKRFTKYSANYNRAYGHNATFLRYGKIPTKSENYNKSSVKLLVRKYHVWVTLREIEDNDLYTIIGKLYPTVKFLKLDQSIY